jgi:hypothetical protein
MPDPRALSWDEVLVIYRRERGITIRTLKGLHEEIAQVEAAAQDVDAREAKAPTWEIEDITDTMRLVALNRSRLQAMGLYLRDWFLQAMVVHKRFDRAEYELRLMARRAGMPVEVLRQLRSLNFNRHKLH